MVERSKRRANGYKGNAAQDKKQVGNDDVTDFVQKNMYDIIFVKQIHKDLRIG